MKGSLATPRRAASSAATPRTTWPSSAYMRMWREAHSACAARSGLLLTAARTQRRPTVQLLLPGAAVHPATAGPRREIAAD